MPSSHTAIRVAGLHKSFRMPRQRVHTFKERALHPFRPTRYDELRVLRGIDFEVREGEFFGIVGRNGSGKSTLLKCLAGIYGVDGGTIEIAGALSPFIELGVGFNPDLTARDNVALNAVMMGLTPRQARARFEEIIAFAELERFTDQKLKNYSSGMQVRLAFSLMVQSDPDVMLIDEVLAVGDASFQQKCIDVFHRLRDEGKTIVLVTHAMAMVERFCHRAMMLSDGHITHIGDPAEVGRTYMSENLHSARDDRGAIRGEEVRLRDAWVSDAGGQRVDTIAQGEPMRLHVAIEAIALVRGPAITIWLTNEDQVRVFSVGAREDGGGALADLEPGERTEFTVELHNLLSAGRYYLGASVTRGSAGLDVLLLRQRAADLLSYGADLYGLVAVAHVQSLTRTRSREAVA